MYERMLEKVNEPTDWEIKNHIGTAGYARLEKLEDLLSNSYDLKRELKFPFGNSYGWGYKYNHKSKHLCYVFFEKGAITVTIQIGTKEAPKLNEIFEELLSKTKELWEDRYPCGDGGGWVHYRVLEDCELADIMKLIAIRKKPLK